MKQIILLIVFVCLSACQMDKNRGNNYLPIAGTEIDLGLTVKWSNCNLGATRQEEYGDYFAWGETAPYYSSLPSNNWSIKWKKGKKSGYDWPSYKWCDDNEGHLTKYNNYSELGNVDHKIALEPQDDAAHATLGGKWRIPTVKEWTELINRCSWENAIENGVSGCKVTGPNGNSIFLPFAGMCSGWIGGDGNGFYWASHLDKRYERAAYMLHVSSKDVKIETFHRCNGISIRPVTK